MGLSRRHGPPLIRRRQHRRRQSGIQTVRRTEQHRPPRIHIRPDRHTLQQSRHRHRRHVESWSPPPRHRRPRLPGRPTRPPDREADHRGDLRRRPEQTKVRTSAQRSENMRVLRHARLTRIRLFKRTISRRRGRQIPQRLRLHDNPQLGSIQTPRIRPGPLHADVPRGARPSRRHRSADHHEVDAPHLPKGTH